MSTNTKPKKIERLEQLILKSGLDAERTLGLEAWADNVLAEAKDKYDGLD